jgi:hypothetical protein
MTVRTLALVAGVLGGLVWLARTVLHLVGVDSGLVDVAYWVGLLLLAVALAGFGTDLVSKGAVWLRAIVAVAFPALVWSVLEAVDPGIEPSVVDGLAGLVVLVLSVRQVRAGRRARAPKRRAGSRAAR